MKNYLLGVAGFLLALQVSFGQGVSINDSGTAPSSSAILVVQAIDKGVLLPRLTTGQRVAVSPATGLLVYDSDTESFWFHDGGAWVELVANDNGLRDNDNDTKVQVEESSDEDVIRFDTQGSERMVVDADGNVRIGTNSPTANLEVNGSLEWDYNYMEVQFCDVQTSSVIPNSSGAKFCALTLVDDDTAPGWCRVWRDNSGNWRYQTGGNCGANACRVMCVW